MDAVTKKVWGSNLISFGRVGPIYSEVCTDQTDLASRKVV